MRSETEEISKSILATFGSLSMRKHGKLYWKLQIPPIRRKMVMRHLVCCLAFCLAALVGAMTSRAQETDMLIFRNGYESVTSPSSHRDWYQGRIENDEFVCLLVYLETTSDFPRMAGKLSVPPKRIPTGRTWLFFYDKRSCSMELVPSSRLNHSDFVHERVVGGVSFERDLYFGVTNEGRKVRITRHDGYCKFDRFEIANTNFQDDVVLFRPPAQLLLSHHKNGIHEEQLDVRVRTVEQRVRKLVDAPGLFASPAFGARKELLGGEVDLNSGNVDVLLFPQEGKVTCELDDKCRKELINLSAGISEIDQISGSWYFAGLMRDFFTCVQLQDIAVVYPSVQKQFSLTVAPRGKNKHQFVAGSKNVAQYAVIAHPENDTATILTSELSGNVLEFKAYRLNRDYSSQYLGEWKEDVELWEDGSPLEQGVFASPYFECFTVFKDSESDWKIVTFQRQTNEGKKYSIEGLPTDITLPKHGVFDVPKGE